MPGMDLIRSFIDYDIAMTGRVWDSIGAITEAQFLADDQYSRGSIRNLMVHLAHTNLRWLTGLKNLPDEPGKFKPYDSYTDRASTRRYSESVRAQVAAYIRGLSEAELHEQPIDIPGPRWEVLLHMVNHGTDHRSTVLQRLHELGAPTFDQDYIIWLSKP